MLHPLLEPDELDALLQLPPNVDNDSFRAAVDALRTPAPAEPSSPEEVIYRFREQWSHLPIPPPSSDVEDLTSSYTTRDGVSLRLCVYKPKGATSSLPLVVWYHGGGMCIGFPEMNAAFLREVAAEHKCVVVAPEYRLGPEVKMPVPVEDGWDALVHVAKHAMNFGADLSLGFIVGGESAGARMAAVLSCQALQIPLQAPLTGTFLSAGAYFDKDSLPEEYKPHYRSRYDPVCLETPFLRGSTKAAFDACLLPDNKSPLYNAALAASHERLPKTYLQACGMDMLRDDTLLYRHLLEKNGVDTRLDVYPGCPHCFWFLLSGTKMGQKWKAESHAGLEWLLGA